MSNIAQRINNQRIGRTRESAQWDCQYSYEELKGLALFILYPVKMGNTFGETWPDVCLVHRRNVEYDRYDYMVLKTDTSGVYYSCDKSATPDMIARALSSGLVDITTDLDYAVDKYAEYCARQALTSKRF